MSSESDEEADVYLWRNTDTTQEDLDLMQDIDEDNFSELSTFQENDRIQSIYSHISYVASDSYEYQLDDAECWEQTHSDEDLEVKNEKEEDFGADDSPTTKKRGRPTGWTKSNEQEEIVDTRRNKRRKRSPVDVQSVAQVLCCMHLCLSYLTTEAVALARNSFQRMSILERSRWILEWLQYHSNFSNEKHEWVTSYSIGGREICLRGWLVVLGFPLSTFYSIRQRFIRGQTIIQGPGNVKGKIGEAAQVALSWLQQFANKFADKLPDSHKLHLPSCITKQSLYDQLSAEAKQQSTTSVSLSHFLRLWRTCMSHIVIPKQSRFSVCDTCLKIKTKLTESISKTERAAYQNLREKHLNQQNMERRKYYKHCSKARNNPDKYLSIIMDAMDQAKTSLPHFSTQSKSLSNIWRLRVHLMAAIVHGIGIFGFFDTFQWAHGSSFTISILVHVLGILQHIPDVLYLQLDNCPGQNKNKYLLGFLSYLVEMKIFKKIKVSFLMVGHTHEDIDQVFSRFSVWIRINNVLTLDSLMNGFENCYKPKPTAVKTHEIYNFGEWLEIADVQNHSKPHTFRIKLNEETGKAEMKYKKWTTDKEWQVCLGTNIVTEDVTIKDRSIHTLSTNTEQINLEKLSTDLETVFRFFPDDQIKQWWKGYIKELQDSENIESRVSNAIVELYEKKTAERNKENEEEQQPDMSDMCDIDTSIPPVIIKQRRKTDINPKREEFVLTYLDKYVDEFPQAGKVLEQNGKQILVHWYKGAKTTVWQPKFIPVKKPFTEWINKKDVFFHSFMLTANGALPKAAKEAVDRYMENL